MTLTTRLSLFFLAMLAVVLAGFSATLYLLARTYLHREAEERLQAAVRTLTAAAEVGPGGVEWEPAERTLAFGPGAGGDQIVWLVSDDRGQVVDCSGWPATEDFLAEVTGRFRHGPRTTGRLDWQGKRWQVSQRWLQPASGGSPPAAPVTRPPAESERKHSALVITVGVPLAPVRSTLRWLAGALVSVSLAVWLGALLVGRAVCGRALRPVSRMAESVREMNAADLGGRLPVLVAGDELADLSRSFNGLLDRLHESFERQRRFTGDASHQLRTPLAALLGQIEVALRRERGPDEYRQVLAAVQRQGMHLRRIVDALLFLARANAEARLPDLEPVALDEWLKEYLHSWSLHPRAADIRVEEAAGEPLYAAVQPALLGELVNILVENACKYSPPGSPITLYLDRQDESVLLTVEDRGCGISEEDLPHVCEPFFRSPDAHRRGVAGLGLGLAIAERLAGAFGGSLGVTSKAGIGSRFTVFLPETTPPHNAEQEGAGRGSRRQQCGGRRYPS